VWFGSDNGWGVTSCMTADMTLFGILGLRKEAAPEASVFRPLRFFPSHPARCFFSPSPRIDELLSFLDDASRPPVMDTALPHHLNLSPFSPPFYFIAFRATPLWPTHGQCPDSRAHILVR